jgi:hypothetical protein
MRGLIRWAALAVCLLVVVLAPSAARGEIVGPAEYVAEYSTAFASPDDYPIASVTLDPAMWEVSRIGGTYQGYPLLLATEDAPLLLSAAEDEFIVYAGTETVRGLTDIAAEDPVLWESLDSDTREAFQYPGDVDSYSVVQIYVLAPALPGDELPDRFEFFVSSLGRTLVLETEPIPMAVASQT